MSLLVTGGSGTLGAAVCREALARQYSVVAYSRDKSRQLMQCPMGVIGETGDIADLYRLVEVCRRHAVREIVHCAAMKHVGECEERPAATCHVNLAGVWNVLQAATTCSVERVVFVSSDKACDRTFYGMSKLIGERLVTDWANTHDKPANSVRLGNLIGSNGSVVDIWRRAVMDGLPIRLDEHKGESAKRFAMHAWEGAEFVMSTLKSESRGAVAWRKMPVLDMGVLCEAISPGTVIRGSLDPAWIHQQASRPREFAGCVDGYSTRDETPMTLAETREWLAAENRPITDKDICS